MAQLIQPFNANNFDPTQGVGGLPIGRHPVVVDSSEVKANKANDGGYLQLNLKVIDGPQAGTVGAYRLNLYHSNPQTVEIANRQLSAISHVTGVYMIQDSAQLHNIPFVIEVGPQKDAQYTEVKKVFDINGNEPGKAPQGGGAAQPQNNGGFGGQQQQPNNGQQGGQQGAGWQQPGGNQGQQGGQQGGQGGGWQPPADNGQQQQPPANGGGAWGGQAGAAQPQGGGFQPPAGGQQQPQGGGQAGGWQQGANAGGAAPWGQR